MGTNYYWLQLQRQDPENEDSIFVHIGKRSAAGAYCWDCHTTLCQYGTEFVHRSEYHGLKVPWFDACPICGKTKEKRPIFDGSAGVELGFTKAADVAHSGVSSCSSFTWTWWIHKWQLESLAARGCHEKVVVNEYGDEFTAEEFFDELSAIAIEQTSPSEFS